MELAAHRGLETMNSAETNPKERGLGKPCAGKPPARFDEGEGSVPGDRLAALSTLPQSDSDSCASLWPNLRAIFTTDYADRADIALISEHL